MNTNTAIAIVLILQIVIVAIAVFAFVYDRRWRIDVNRIADVMAASLISEYGEGINVLNADGVKAEMRRRYQDMAATFGLPSAPADFVADRVWQHIEDARGATPNLTGLATLYE